MNKKKKSPAPKPSEPLYDKMIQDRDVMVPMRDGIHVCVDIYRPDGAGKFQAILAYAAHNKDLQTLDIADAIPPQPAWSHLWQGGMEAGDTMYLVSRGKVRLEAFPTGLSESLRPGPLHVKEY